MISKDRGGAVLSSMDVARRCYLALISHFSRNLKPVSIYTIVQRD